MVNTENKTTRYRNFDEGTEFLTAEERDTFLRTIRHIADTAIEAGCRELLVADLEIINSITEKNDAMFEEWING